MSAPESLNLSAAAAEVVYWQDNDLGDGHDWATLEVWKKLTRILDDADAVDYARQVAAADPPILAAPIPF